MKDIRVSAIKLKDKSKSSEFASWSAEGNSIIDELIRTVYLSALFIIDLLVFIYFSNARIWEDDGINKAFLYCCGGIFVFNLVLVLVLSFSKVWQNIVCAIITGVMFVIFCNQFLILNLDEKFARFMAVNASFLSFLTNISVYWYLGALVALLVYVLFYSIYGTIFVTVVLILVSLLGIKNAETKDINFSEYVTVKQAGRDHEISKNKNKNIVYFILPKFPSYQFLDSVNNDNFKELKNLMMGFFALNGFEVYSNAFIVKPDIINNIAEIYNQVDYLNPKGIDRGFAEYVNNWQFVRGGLALASLEDNKLYKYLKERGYGISTYSMPEFNLCYTSDKMNTDRCVVKKYKRISLYNKEVSVKNNVYALLAEWIDSFNLKVFSPIVRGFADKSWLKNMKVLSRNRRIAIEGSAEVFDQVEYDVSKDGVGHVYMVYVDMPSVGYVYDEFCNIKPRKKWVALNDNNIYAGGINEKRKAYAEQAKCLIGKMQFFINELRDMNKLDKTDVILQGVTGIRELTDMKVGKYANFVVDNLVGMGIRKGKHPHFLINSEICLASDFSKSHIKDSKYCYSVDSMKISNEELGPLKNSLIKNSYIKKHRLNNVVENYKDWYSLFEKNNVRAVKVAKEKQEKRKNSNKLRRKRIYRKVVEVKKERPVEEEIKVEVEDVEDGLEKEAAIKELLNEGEILIDKDMFEYIVGDDDASMKGGREIKQDYDASIMEYGEEVINNEKYLGDEAIEIDALEKEENIIEDVDDEMVFDDFQIDEPVVEKKVEEAAKVIDISDSVEIDFEDEPLENIF